jgi:arginine/lysine/ornithine decarboxylase
MLNFGKSAGYLILELQNDATRLLVVKKTRDSYVVLHSQDIESLNWQTQLEFLQVLLQNIKNNYKCKNVLLSLPKQSVEYHQRPLATTLTLSNEEIIETAHLEFEQLYSNSQDYYFDFDVVNDTNSIVLVTLPKQRIEKLVALFTLLKFKIVLITADCSRERLAQEGLHAHY